MPAGTLMHRCTCSVWEVGSALLECGAWSERSRLIWSNLLINIDTAIKPRMHLHNTNRHTAGTRLSLSSESHAWQWHQQSQPINQRLHLFSEDKMCSVYVCMFMCLCLKVNGASRGIQDKGCLLAQKVKLKELIFKIKVCCFSFSSLKWQLLPFKGPITELILNAKWVELSSRAESRSWYLCQG